MRTIQMHDIARALWDARLAIYDGEKTALNFTVFRDIMLQSGTIQSMPTIKTKWIAFGGEVGVSRLKDGAYLVDTSLFAVAHGFDEKNKKIKKIRPDLAAGLAGVCE